MCASRGPNGERCEAVAVWQKKRHAGLCVAFVDGKVVEWEYRAPEQSSRFVGVYFDKDRKRWVAQVKEGKRYVNLGRHPTEEAAAMARMRYLESKSWKRAG